jgi:hypothetical protein
VNPLGFLSVRYSGLAIHMVQTVSYFIILYLLPVTGVIYALLAVVSIVLSPDTVDGKTVRSYVRDDVAKT